MTRYLVYIDAVHHAYVKDYRGDVRAVVTERDGVVETNDYYPYGMVMCLPWSDMWQQPYKIMGKELDRENGWDSYDVQARWLTSSIAQWTTPDPLADATPWLSPYSYCGGDPVNFVDPTGKEKIYSFDKQKEEDQKLIQYANRYPNDNAIHIFMHGSNKSVETYNNNTANKTTISTSQEFISQVLSNSKVWNEAKNSGENVTIILHSCSTAKGKDSFAETLSKSEEFKGDNIIAPTAKVRYVPDKDKAYVADVEANGDKTMGKWQVYKDGKVIASYDGTWQPKESPSLLDKLFH